MDERQLPILIDDYLHTLCVDVPHRHVGSAFNQQATAFFRQTLEGFDFATECPQFRCIDWQSSPVRLECMGEAFAAHVSPYAPACAVRAPLLAASTVEELAELNCRGNILLLHGELTREQLMPKNFVFYNPAEHQRIIGLLEAQQPAAIIAATGRNPELAGGWYPFPLIEDGDFDIPSVYMTDVEGEKLMGYAGGVAELAYESARIPSTGCNVVARKGQGPRRIVVTAHIDSKPTTPGALDNAGGVATLLGLGSLLRDYAGSVEIEILTLNGEDYYAASGHMRYLADNQDRWENIIVAINLDLAGYRDGQSAWSSYNCPFAIEAAFQDIVNGHTELVEGLAWYQSDHSMFIQQGCPAIAITSEHFMQLAAEITHTAHDTIELVDSGKLAANALALNEFVRRLAGAGE
jgi:aminopeptidase YwaD